MNEIQLSEAWRLHRAGDFQKAANLYRDIIRADPRNYEALNRLGFLHGKCGQWEKAQYFMGKRSSSIRRRPTLISCAAPPCNG